VDAGPFYLLGTRQVVLSQRTQCSGGPVGAKSTQDQLLGRTDAGSNAQPRHSSRTGLHEDVLNLQRAVGNRAVNELLRARDNQLEVDLHDVRIHTGPDADAQAHALGTAAYASGRDVYLSSRIDLATNVGQAVFIGRRPKRSWPY
jgi:hypothetical protein